MQAQSPDQLLQSSATPAASPHLRIPGIHLEGGPAARPEQVQSTGNRLGVFRFSRRRGLRLFQREPESSMLAEDAGQSRKPQRNALAAPSPRTQEQRLRSQPGGPSKPDAPLGTQSVSPVGTAPNVA